MHDFVICVGCERHVRPNESDCPFCGEVIDARSRPAGDPLLRPTRRRGGFVTVAAVAAAAAIGCAGDDDSADAAMDAPRDVFVGADVYGLPDVGFDSGFDAGFDADPGDADPGDAEMDAPRDVFVGGDVYGLPPSDGGDSG